MAKRFLRLLVDIDDDNAWVGRRAPARLKAIVEAAEFQTCDEIEQRHGPLAQKRYVINSESRKRDNQADGERSLVAPPFAKNSDEFFAAAVRHTCREINCDG